MRFSAALLSILATSITTVMASPVDNKGLGKAEARCTPGSYSCHKSKSKVWTTQCNTSGGWEYTAVCAAGHECKKIGDVTYCVPNRGWWRKTTRMKQMRMMKLRKKLWWDRVGNTAARILRRFEKRNFKYFYSSMWQASYYQNLFKPPAFASDWNKSFSEQESIFSFVRAQLLWHPCNFNPISKK